MNDIAGIGHNSGLDRRVNELVSAANQWAPTEVADQEIADALTGFIGQIRAAIKEVDAAKDTEKRPHLDANLAIEAKYKPLKAMLEAARAIVQPKADGWLMRLKAENEARAKVARAEAQRKLDEAHAAAAKAALEAAKGQSTVQTAVAAELAAEAAAEAQKQADAIAHAKVNQKSSMGARTMSLRTTWHGRVTSVVKAAIHFQKHPDLIACLERLASAEARSAVADADGNKVSTIPGVEFYADQKAA